MHRSAHHNELRLSTLAGCLLLVSGAAHAQPLVTSADVVSREVSVSVPRPVPTVAVVSRAVSVATGPSVVAERRTVVSRELTVDSPKSDLVVVALEVPTSGVAGRSIEVRWRVENAGRGVARESWTDRLTLTGVEPPSSSVTLAAIAHAELESVFDDCAAPPCGVYEKVLGFTLPATAGSYRLTVEVDRDGAVAEADETNNVAEALVQVRPAFLADLEVSSITSPTSGVLAGSTVAVSYTVTNSGAWPTSAPFWKDSVFLTASDSGLSELLADEPHFLGQFGNATFLAAGASYAQTVEVRLPDDIEGTYHIAIVPDSRRVSAPQWRRGAPYDVAEVSEDNAGFSAPFAIVAPPQPNLRVVEIEFISPAFSGAPFEVTWTVENAGTADTDSGEWIDEVSISDDDDPVIHRIGELPAESPDILIGSVRRRGLVLGPGERDATRVVQARLPVDLRGERFVKVRTDATNTVSEFRLEDDNVGVSSGRAACVSLCDQDPDSDACRSCGVLDVVLSPAVDLLPGDVVVSPDTGIPGHPLDVSWTVTNIGAPFPFAVTWRDEVWLSSDTTFDPGIDRLIGSRSVSSLLLDASGGAPRYAASTRVVLPADTPAGPRFVLVIADANRKVFEGFTEAPGDESRKENNNVASAALPIVQMPTDLVLELGCDGCPDLPAAAASLETIELAWRVTNSGAHATPASVWRDRVYLSRDAVPDPKDIRLAEFIRSASAPLAAGASYVARRTVTVPAAPPGDQFLLFATDVDDAVFEAPPGEENNTIAVPFTVLPDGPDLAVVELDFNETATSGSPVQIAWRVANAGNLATRALSWEDRVYLSIDDRIDFTDVLLGSWVHERSLAPAESAGVSASFTLPLALSGCFHVIVEADAAGEVFETDETNNTRAEMMLLDIDLAPLANLVVTSVEADAQAVSGQTMTVEWTVENLGPGPTNVAAWRDSVYLSRDAFVDPRRDLFLGFREHRGILREPDGLGVLDGSTERATFDVPLGASGPYFAFVITDAGGMVIERDEDDNQARDTSVTNVVTPPLANLVVTAVETPPFATLGEPVHLEWQLEVTTAQSVTGRWSDSLFLSRDTAWDLGDTLLGRFEVAPGTLAAGAPFIAAGDAVLPGVVPGDYHVIARADVFNQIPETDEADNEAVSLGAMSVSAPALVLDPESGAGSVETTLEGGASRWFEMRVPPELAGATLRVRLEHASANAWTELFISRAEVPSPNRFEFRFDRPAEPAQEVTIPALADDVYYILARALPSAAPLVPSTAELAAEVVPFAVESAAPLRLGDRGRVTVEVRGSQFEPGATAELVPIADGADGAGAAAIAARSTRVDDATRLIAKFVLDPTRVARGAYRLRVVNPGGEPAELLDEVTVEAVVAPLLDVAPAAPPPLREGGEGSVACVVTNPGKVDAEYVFLLLATETLDGRAVLRSVASSPLTASGVDAGLRADSAVVRSLRPGESAALTLTMRADVGAEGDIALGQAAAVFTTAELLDIQSAAAEAARRAALDDPDAFAEAAREQALEDAQDAAVWRAAWLDRLVAAELVDVEDAAAHLAGEPLVVAPPPPPRAACFPRQSSDATPPFCDTLAEALCDAWLRHALSLGAGALGVFAEDVDAAALAAGELDPVLGPECADVASHCASCVTWSVLRSVDPNEKSGTKGFGNARFVPIERPLSYRVSFENLPDASGPASAVEIIDPLDISLSAGSLRLGDIAFGDVVVDVPDNSLTFQRRVDLTAERGVLLDVTAGVDATAGHVFWSFRSVDPETGEPPADASLGFLPPDVEGSGSGWVEYNARPLPTVLARTVVKNDARIRFDANAPLNTGTVLNTIDTDAPASHVDPLAPVQAEPRFLLTWSGEDVAGGSGLAGFTIYVAVDGGPAVPLLTDTTATSWSFEGEPGHGYAFSSRAKDNAGNVEALPLTPDATTTVGGLPRFRRGDANNDARFDISDAVFTLVWRFLAGPAASCPDAADANDDGIIDIADASYTLNALFVAGPPLPEPAPPDCGTDPTPDALADCEYAEASCGG